MNKENINISRINEINYLYGYRYKCIYELFVDCKYVVFKKKSKNLSFLLLLLLIGATCITIIRSV